MLALVKDRVVGSASLHFGERPKRHTAEIRLFLAKDFRRRGLGVKMIRTSVDLARKQGLAILTVEVIADETRVVKASESQGFKLKATFDDGFMFADGEPHDLLLLVLALQAKADEF